MENGLADAIDGLERPLDQMVSALCQGHDENILRYQIIIDQPAGKVEIILAGGRKRHFYVFETDLAQQMEVFQLLPRIKRVG